MGEGSLFKLGALDISPLIDTVKENAPLIITAGITITLTLAAINLVPRLIKKNIKG